MYVYLYVSSKKRKYAIEMTHTHTKDISRKARNLVGNEKP